MGLVQRLDGVRLRRIDVPDWDCAVARSNSIRSLPTLWLYDGKRKLSGDVRDVMTRLLERARG